MPLRQYRCSACGLTRLAFEEEEHRLRGECASAVEHNFDVDPLTPTVVHATNVFGADDARLDSHVTVYELDRILTLEAREEREAKAYQEARRNS